jgi:hypothetical protein
MPTGTLPDDVRRFLLTSALRVPHVEAIVLMRRDPGALWRASLLATRLYVGKHAARQLLQRLAELGVVRPDDAGVGYRYLPATPELAGLLERLDQAYAADLIGITRLIHSVEASAAQAFADAFTLRKEPP